MSGIAVAADRWTEWDRFVAAAPDGGFMQTSWWADFRARADYRHFGVILRHGGAVIGGAMVQKLPYSSRSTFYYIQDGPVLPKDPEVARAVFEAVLAAVDEDRKAEPSPVSHLRIEPRWLEVPPFVSGFRQVNVHADGFIEPRLTLYVNLRRSEADILQGMTPKGRYNVRLAQRHGVSVVEDSSTRGVRDFVRLYRAMHARKHIIGKPPSYFKDLVASLVENRAGSVFFAEYLGKRLAGAIVVMFGGRATYLFGASFAAHREVMAPYLLQYRAMCEARSRGCEWYDLWGIARPDDPNDPWKDLTVFHRRFGGTEVSLVPPLDLVYDRPAYDAFVASERTL